MPSTVLVTYRCIAPDQFVHTLLPPGAVVCSANTTGDPLTSSDLASYVENTRQYLLTFVCNSPGNPADGIVDHDNKGSAWFYSVSDDLSNQTNWSTPKQIIGSFSKWTNTQDAGCPVFNGWYPTFMSLGQSPSILGTSGFAFYMWGSLGGCDTPGQAPPPRHYSSRRFTIITVPK